MNPGLAPNITSSTQVVIAEQGQQHIAERGENIAEAGEHGAHGAQQGEQFVAGVECLTFIQSVTCSAPLGDLHFVVQWTVNRGLAPNITSSTQVVHFAEQGQQHIIERGGDIAEAGEHEAQRAQQAPWNRGGRAQQGEQFVAEVERLTFIQSFRGSTPSAILDKL